MSLQNGSSAKQIKWRIDIDVLEFSFNSLSGNTLSQTKIERIQNLSVVEAAYVPWPDVIIGLLRS